MEKYDQLALLKNREHLYRLLMRLYLSEVDEKHLQLLKGLVFPQLRDENELGHGYRLLEQSLEEANEDILTELAVDYARIFLGAGIASLEVAYPYESVYTGKKLIMQEARDEAVAIYYAKGLQKSKHLDFPEDHIALELEFLAFLCRESIQIAKAGEQSLTRCYEEQLRYLGRLLKWVPKFCDDVEKYAETMFYKALAKITRSYLRMDYELLENLAIE